MSIVPLVFGEFLDDFFRPATVFDNGLGFGILTDDCGHAHRRPLMKIRHQCRNGRPQPRKETPVTVEQAKDTEFKVSFDVRQFSPENLSVKVVGNTVMVDGKYEEREDDNSYVSSQFSRRYVLPESVDPATVVSSLSSDGVLSIRAPKKVDALPSSERVVPILQAQQPDSGSIQAGGGNKTGDVTEKMDQ